MVRNYIFGEPIETDAVVKEIASSAWCDGVFQKKEDGFHYSLKEDEIVYGLGENVRGINKRGWRYISNCSDNPNHCENTNSLYGAHNFIMVGDVVHETYGLLSAFCVIIGNTAFILILSLYQKSSEKSRKYGIFTTSYMLVST